MTTLGRRAPSSDDRNLTVSLASEDPDLRRSGSAAEKVVLNCYIELLIVRPVSGYRRGRHQSG